MSNQGQRPGRGPSGKLRFESAARDGVTSGQVGPKSKRRSPIPKSPDIPGEPPPSDAPETSPPVEDTPATSGHVGPKSKNRKFKRDSEQTGPPNGCGMTGTRPRPVKIRAARPKMEAQLPAVRPGPLPAIAPAPAGKKRHGTVSG